MTNAFRAAALRMAGLVSSAALLTGATGCTHGNSSTPAASAVPSSPAASTASPGLGGGAGEQTSTAVRSTIITTPTPKLSTEASGREIDKSCPYISDQAWADGEGNRVGRSVQLAGTPVGCRFYFQYDPTQITGEITIEKFGTPTEAFNAVVGAAKLDPGFVDDRSIGNGGSISVRLPLQGEKTWACIFSKGVYAVTVHTSQTDTSKNGRNLAAQIAPMIR
jgi:hypothetical protein